VAQYAPIGPFYMPARDDYQSSGYRHTRSSLQFGGSVDHYHRVEEWGRPVRPYDEWRFPFRPYAVPYPEWGPPFAGLNFGYPGYAPFPYAAPQAPGPNPPAGGNPNVPGGNPNFPGFPGFNFPGFNAGPNPFQPFVPYRGFQPWFDDRYPSFDDRAPFRRQPFPVVP
jgi:hypothetical protein